MKQLFVAFCTVLWITSFANEDKGTTNAKLQSVTVFRSGAEMVHTATATLKEGSNELVIEQISTQIDENSIQVKVVNSIAILSTAFSTNYLKVETKSARIKMLEDSIASMSKTITRLNKDIANITDVRNVLKQNSDIKGAQTGLSVAELIKLIDFYKAKNNELENEQSLLSDKRDKLQLLLNKIQSQLYEEQNKHTEIGGRITLQLQVAEAGKYSFEISYIAINAHWTPFYDLRVDDIKHPIKLLYKANIAQQTGIDWKQVKLSLSTASPSQSGEAPLLKAWFLSYIYPNARTQYPYATNSIPQLKSKALAYDDLKEEVISYSSAKRSLGKLEDHVQVADNMLNVNFDIDIPYDIPSTGKEQMAVLKSYDVPGSYKHYSVPKLDKDVYILAEVTDWEKLNLLPGIANIIFEGTYTGKTFIDPMATQDTLNISLGRDKRVVVKREKLVDYSSVKFLGNNKLQKFTYEITVKNNKKEAINLLLKDQFPLTTNKEIEVELLDNAHASINQDLGVLNWELNIPAGESKKVRFTYTIKYPKDKTLNLN